MTLKKWLDTWLHAYIINSGRAASTIRMYQRSINAIPPELGERDLAKLGAWELAGWIGSIYAQHPRAAQLDRVMLSQALGAAHDCGLINWELTRRNVPKLKHEAKKANILTETEAASYLAEARKHEGGILLLLCLCGLRRGEALGVRRSDLDGAKLTIRRQRQREPGQGLIVKSLKTRSSLRIITLPKILIEEVNRLPVLGDGYLYDTTPERLQQLHKLVLQKAGINSSVTLHGLRHTFASTAARSETMKSIQQALGHSTYKLTADLYSDHLLPESGNVAVRVFSRWGA